MKIWKELSQLLPALIVITLVTTGLKLTVPVFEEISWPTPPVFAQADTVRESEEDSETESETESETVEAGIGDYEDGVHIGQGVGYSGTVRVQVTVKEHQITDIEILSHSDTISFFENAKGVIWNVLNAQTWEVDTISGATYSSRGILEAVRNALTGEISTSPVGEQGTVSNGPVQESSYKKGTLKDGSYTGSAQGFGGQVKVKVTIKGGKITDIKVVDHASETELYYQKATAIISKIMKAQSPNVDTISGATYSSNGIREAVKEALRKASGTKKSDKNKKKKSQKETEHKEQHQTETETESENETGEVDYGITLKEDIEGDMVIYTGEVLVDTDSAGKAFSRGLFTSYQIHVRAVFVDGGMKNMEVQRYMIPDEVSDGEYYDDQHYTDSALSSLLPVMTRKGTSSIDTISGATCSSKALIRFYQAAKQEYARYLKKHQAETEEENTETIPETEPMSEKDKNDETEEAIESEIVSEAETEAETEPKVEAVTEVQTEAVETMTDERTEEETEKHTEKHTEIRTKSEEEREEET